MDETEDAWVEFEQDLLRRECYKEPSVSEWSEGIVNVYRRI